MPGSRQCILHSYNKYRTPDDDSSMVRTLGLGVCCVLGMYRGLNAAENESDSKPEFNARVSAPCKKLQEDKLIDNQTTLLLPELQEDKLIDNQTTLVLQELQEDELISTFCKTRFTLISLKDRSEWERKVQKSFERLDFAISTAVEHQDELRACLLGIELALREAALEAKWTLTGSEISTVKVIQNIMEQLDNAITKLCPGACAADFRQSIANITRICQASSKALSDCEAWHKRAQPLLVQALLARDQMPEEESVWDEMGGIISQASIAFRTLGLSDDEQNMLAQLMKVAAACAPLYPCAATCASSWYDLHKEAFPTKKLPYNADTILPESFCQVGLESKRSEQPATTHQSSGTVVDTEPPVFGPEFWARPPWFPIPCEDLREHKTLAIVEKDVASLVTAIEEALLQLKGHRGLAEFINITEQLHKLIASLSLLGKDPPLDLLASAVLRSMRSSLMAAKAELKSSRGVCMASRDMARLNEAILIISRHRHQACLANLKGSDALRPQEFASLKEVTYSPNKPSLQRCIAFAAYSALLTTDSEEEAKQFLDDIFTFIDVAGKPIDSITAQLCLSTLLYLKHDNVKLLKRSAQNALGKLIARLRDEIFVAEKIDIPIRELPEFRELYLNLFEGITWQEFDWRDSLRVKPTLASDGHRPVINKLIQYGRSFREDSGWLTELSREGEIFAPQLESLKAFRSRLLRIDPPESVFADDQTLAYLEQFAAFAGRCLDECQVDGTATGYQQVQILEVTLYCLQWCRFLSSYLKETSPRILEKAYNMTAKALILKDLWNSQLTACMHNSERAFISRGILSALKSNKLDDELLACIRMFIGQKVPSRFVARLFDELLLDRSKQNSDYDKMVTLLALECRLQLFRAEVASGSGITAMPSSIIANLNEALDQAQKVAEDARTSLASALTLNARLQERFVAPDVHKAARQLSLDVVLAEALKCRNPDQMTVGQVAYHVATYLLGDCADERWLEFLTRQTKWCSFTPLQLAKRPHDLMTTVQRYKTLLKAISYKPKGDLLLDNSTETTLTCSSTATQDLIRQFVLVATFKWLCDKVLLHDSSVDTKRLLINAVGEHVTAWIPKWLTLMQGWRVLFPPGVTATAGFLERMCADVANQKNFRDEPVSLDDPLEPEKVSTYLYRCLKRAGTGTLTPNDLKFLLKSHARPILSRQNRNMFLILLLWVWHHRSLPVKPKVIKKCIADFYHEGGRPGKEGEVPVQIMQNCIRRVASSCSASHTATERDNET